ncbi:MAG: imidazole glycerol phosphate synthase subunit HisH [Pseudomonadota bacterium]
MKLAIVDYGSGNLRSAAKAFERAAGEANTRCEISVTADPDLVANADRIILPGVGAFRACRDGLFALDGMVEALEGAIFGKGRPLFGICVGMQLLADIGEEFGETPGLGWIGGRVIAIPPKPGRIIPHMGWNTLAMKKQTVIGGEQEGVETLSSHTLFKNIDPDDHAYFVHSYHMVADAQTVVAETNYDGVTLAAAVAKDNIFATQFHPEKSQRLGLQLFQNFLGWEP